MVERGEESPGGVELDRLVESFIAELRSGGNPEIHDYETRAPHLAEEIRELFPAIEVMEQLCPEAEECAEIPGEGPDWEGSRKLGDFRILRRIGQGGMGEVFEAEQVSLGRRVALKILPPQATLNPDLLERFRREARAAAKLHHTNIVPVFEVGEEEGVHYYAMQFVRGHSLKEVLEELRSMRRETGSGDCTPARALVDASTRSSGRPPEGTYYRQVARLGRQVAGALEYAHREGLVHRDIKPSNLILDSRGTLWVADFGLAKAEGIEGLTEPGDLVGTALYMAPERLRGIDDHRGDVYGLGATLYELLTLRPPFEGTDRLQLLRMVQETEPQRPSRVDADIPRDLETIVLKAMAKDPARRYRTAEALGEDLRHFLAMEPIIARRAGACERALKWARRRPATAGLMAVSLLAILAVVGGVLWHSQRLGIALRQVRAENAAKTAATAALDEALQFQQCRQDIRVAADLLRTQGSEQEARCFLERIPERYRGWLWSRLMEHQIQEPIRGNLQLQDGAIVYDIAFSPDGTHLVSVGGGWVVNVWRLEDRKLVHSIPTVTEFNYSLSFSPDGQKISVGGGNGWVHVFDLQEGNTHRFQMANGTVETIRWVTEDRLFVVSRDGAAAVVGATDGSVLRPLCSAGELLRCGELNPGRSKAATGSDSGQVRVYSLETGEVTTLPGVQSGDVLDIEFTDDERYLVAVGNQETRQYELGAEPRLVGILPMAPGVDSVLIPDPALREWVLATGGSDGRLELHGLKTVGLFYRKSVGPLWLTALAVSPDQRTLALVVGEDGELLFWPIRD